MKHLHSFRAMAEALNFINAARKLHISQPALSAQIQTPEAELGVHLEKDWIFGSGVFDVVSGDCGDVADVIG
jgi:hypothetical protein